MKFIKQLIIGYRAHVEAVNLIFKHKMWIYFIFPLLLFGLAFYYGHYFHNLRVSMEDSPGGILKWFKKIWFYFLEFLNLKLTKYIIFIVLSPLLAYLSEKTEKILTGNTYKFKLIQFIQDVKRGIMISARMFIAEYLTYLVWVIIAYIVGLTKYNEIASIIIGSYYYGFGFIDYINERRRLSIGESFQFVKKNAGLTFSIGSVFSLLFYVPEKVSVFFFENSNIYADLGILIAPVWCIVAATIAVHKIVDLNTNEYAVKKNL